MKRLSKKLALGGLGRFFFILLLSLFTLTTAHAQDAKELYKKSVKTIINTFPDNIKVFPGHGDTFRLRDYTTLKKLVIE